MLESELIERAARFAIIAHANQKRKYTGEPYVTHVMAVANIVQTVSHTDEMIAAALLHDVLEDTPTTLELLKFEFGSTVADYVYYLTDVSKGSTKPRPFRKSADAEHVSSGPAEVHTIKVADIIDNTASIHLHDPKFWHNTYKFEKKHLLSKLVKADPILLERAKSQLLDAW